MISIYTQAELYEQKAFAYMQLDSKNNEEQLFSLIRQNLKENLA